MHYLKGGVGQQVGQSVLIMLSKSGRVFSFYFLGETGFVELFLTLFVEFLVATFAGGFAGSANTGVVTFLVA